MLLESIFETVARKRPRTPHRFAVMPESS